MLPVEQNNSASNKNENAALDLARAILETIPALNRSLRERVAAIAHPQVSLPQFRVLSRIATWGTMSLRELAEMEAVKPPTMCRVVKTLASRGLLKSTREIEDLRQVSLELSPEGADLVRKVREEVVSRIALNLGDWDAARCDSVREGLTDLRSSSLYPKRSEK